MKRTLLLFFLLAGLIVVPAIAQDFTSSRPQFLSFSFGVPIGYNLDAEEMVSGHNFGFDFAVMDNMTIGYDRLVLAGDGFDYAANLMRVAFSFDGFGPQGSGAAIGFGSDGNEAVVSLGVFANLVQARAANGLAYGLGLRVDYLAPTDSFGDGSIIFTIRATFGL
jgi:hypothetical protein